MDDRPKTKLDELYKHWKCGLTTCKNFGYYCWVDNANDKHYIITTSNASRWVKLYLNSPPLIVPLIDYARISCNKHLKTRKSRIFKLRHPVMGIPSITFI